MSTAPHIFLSRPTQTARGGWGLPLILDGMTGNDHDNWAYRHSVSVDGIRDMLYNYAIHFQPKIVDQAAKYNHLIMFNMVLGQVFKDYFGRKQKVIADIFSKNKNWIRNNYDRPGVTHSNFFET